MALNTRLLKNKVLTVFFTQSVSLSTWDKVGSIKREVEIYNQLARFFKKIYFVTYGKDESEIQYSKILKNNIRILPKKVSLLPDRVYVFLVPLLYFKELQESDYYKTNQMHGATAALLAKLFFRKKLIIRCGYELLRFYQLKNKPFWKLKLIYIIEKCTYWLADKIIISSRENERFILRNFRIKPVAIKVIPNYVNTAFFKPMRDIRKKERRICCVARLEKQKNISNLIRAMSDMEVELVIYGDGGLKNDLQLFARQMNTNVVFRGGIPNDRLPYEINQSVLFILPSLFEGNPKALLEAMSCGLPCIGTNVEGIREIIRHKFNGYLCETSSSSIKEAVVTLLNDHALQMELGRNAREYAVGTFALDKIFLQEL
ncbi:MAG: glycosyltransferase family 4 protein, partial [Candidatus Omnitrophica bacterium]|nr:glycosyltransferase family 4 protein [Candidatus Omnitrophota bacterium]